MANKVTGGFYIGGVLGWRTYRTNWEKYLKGISTLKAVWLDEATLAPEQARWRNNIGPAQFPKINRLVEASRIRSLCRHSKLDFVFSEGAGINLFSSINVPKFAVIDATPIQLQSFGELYGHKRDFGFNESFKHRYRRLAYSKLDLIYCASEWARQSLIDDYGVDAKRTVTLPLGVSIERFTLAPSATHSDCKILFIGGDFYRKGGDLLVRWFRAKARPGISITFVTRTPLPNLPLGCNVVTDLDATSGNFPEFLKAHDIFCLPTRGDCSSIALMEAAASSLPAVISDVGGVGELVVDDVTGYRIRVGNYEDMCQRLDTLVEDPDLRFEMGRSARGHAEKCFSFTANADVMLCNFLARATG